MQMVTNDILTIQPPSPLAFVLANGDSFHGNKDFPGPFAKKSMVIIARLMINLDLCGSAH